MGWRVCSVWCQAVVDGKGEVAVLVDGLPGRLCLLYKSVMCVIKVRFLRVDLRDSLEVIELDLLVLILEITKAQRLVKK